MLLQNLRPKNNKQAIIENDIDHRRSWDDKLVPCILGDIIIESNISKSWRSAVIQRKKKLKTAQVPWLVLPPDHHQPRTTSLKFFDFTLGCFGNINLPTTLFRWWYCGSSKGWLVIAKGWYFNPKLVLYNPNSGVQLQLLRLKTIPSFKDFLREKKHDDYDITHFIEKIELSCSCEDNSNNCTVAASFYNQTTLALCRPGDKSWRIFKDSGADHQRILYALIIYNDNDVDAAVAETHDHSMRIGDNDNDQDVVVKLIPLETLMRTSSLRIIDPIDPNIWVHEHDDNEDDEDNDDLNNHTRDEDEPNDNEDNHYNVDEEHDDNENDEDNDDLNDHNEDEEPNDNEDEEDDDDDTIINFNNIQTSKFKVFKIDYPSANNNNNMSVTRLNNLGDRMLFVSKSGSVSVQVSKSKDEMKKNYIFFIEEEDENYPTTISRESDIYYLENEGIERSLPSINLMSWFSPNLF
ncbi:hypothetical protein Dsin_026709 [Dipteronia sinensis]|uniref:KIB1-4 beta-propeller domain-containing protein n=1 Tax=Dipteronia sinensis TaxID=43782 RepID=A0AAD9ZZ58_9ROSI|nr:hypothetical protein Dsin_026709 [Dipteronia sinensis]